MKRHKIILPMLRNTEVKFWTPVNFEVEYFLNEETEGVLTDTVIYRVSDKKSYSSFWFVFKNACANLIQTYHGHSLKDGKNYSHKSKQLGRVTTPGMRLA